MSRERALKVVLVGLFFTPGVYLLTSISWRSLMPLAAPRNHENDSPPC